MDIQIHVCAATTKSIAKTKLSLQTQKGDQQAQRLKHTKHKEKRLKRRNAEVTKNTHMLQTKEKYAANTLTMLTEKHAKEVVFTTNKDNYML